MTSEEVRTTSSTGGEKGVKPERFSLIPVEALEVLAKLYGFGAQKYSAHNWRKGYEWSKSYDALQRHANAFWRGEDYDEETGLPHLAGVIFHAMTLIVFMEEQPDYDDRFVTPDPEINFIKTAVRGVPFPRVELMDILRKDLRLFAEEERLNQEDSPSEP